MPLFIPVNPPSVPKAINATGSNDTTAGPLNLRLEEQICLLIQEYKIALRLWAAARYKESYLKFDELCKHNLISAPQELHSEQECNAYCNEYGGMGIGRLRTLVFVSAGRVYVLSDNGPDLCIGLEGLGSLDLTSPRMLSTLCDETVLRRALVYFTKAISFGNADMSHYLAIGQCALLLSKPDMAISMFSQALGLPQPQNSLLSDVHISSWVLSSKVTGPRQWWCTVAGMHAFLIRGDVELADSIARNALNLYSNWNCISSQPNENEDNGFDHRVAAPPIRKCFALPYISALADNKPVTPLAVELHGDCNSVSLERLGSAILDLYDRHIDGEPVASSDRPVTQVEYRVNLVKPTDHSTWKTELQDQGSSFSAHNLGIVCSPDTDTNPEDIGFRLLDVPGPNDQISTSITDNAVSSSHKDEDGDKALVSTEDSGTGEPVHSVKRQGSQSEDEMPAKRRSARFSERANTSSLTNASGVTGTGHGQGAANNARIAPARSYAHNVMAMSPEPHYSPALKVAKERAAGWLEAAGLVDKEIFKVLLEKSSVIAGHFAQQQQKHQQGSVGRKRSVSPFSQSEGEVRTCSFWCVSNANDNSSSKEYIIKPLMADSEANLSETRYLNSLQLLFQSQRSSTSDSSREGMVLPDTHRVAIDECRYVVENNLGIVDLLIWYFDKLAEVYYSSPVEVLNSPQLMQAAFKVANTLHEPLLDHAYCRLSVNKPFEEHRMVIRYATFLLLVFTTATSDNTIPNVSGVCAYMRGEWIRLVRDAISILGLSTSDKCVLQYQVVEAWTTYEGCIVTDDIDRAIASIFRCRKLMEELLQQSNDVTSVARCSFSGAPVTLSLISQRHKHLCLFADFRKAAKLASDGDGHATALLESAIKPFSEAENSVLAFPQTILAIRLLASLYRQTSAAEDEAYIIMYELYMYTSQLLGCSDDASVPLRLIVRHCVSCLQRIQQLYSENPSVRDRLATSCTSKPHQHFAAQMVALSLGFTSHFRLDLPTDYPPNLTETRYIGLLMWLASVLTSKNASICGSLTTRCMFVGENDGSDNPPISNRDVALGAASTSSSNDGPTPDTWVQYTSALHDLLGERKLCTSADGALLLYLLSGCREQLRSDSCNDVYWDMAAGCLRCLFDIKLHGSDTEAHPNAHIEMDEEAANLVFTLVESELLDTLRSRKGSGLRGDLKAIVDKTSSVLGDFDITKYPRISMNMDAIDDYLDGPSMPLFAQVNKALCTNDWIIVPTSCLPTKRLVFNDLKATSAHLNMPFVRAVTQHDLLLSRMRSGLTRAVEEYDNIIEDYKLNVAINPTSSEAWYYLAQAHSDLADELLLGTASEIISSRYDIAVLQRSAVSCAVQAKQLLPPLHAGSTPSSGDDSNSSDEDLFEQNQKLHIRLYSFVGCLLYRIASKPLSLLAFQILPSNVLVPDDDVDEERQEWDTGVWKPFKQTAHTMSAAEGGSVASIAQALTRRFVKAPPRLQVYSLACKLLAVASRLDAENWKWVYMLGKAMAKLGRPLSACTCYLKIAHLEISSNAKYTSSVIGSLPSTAHTLSSASGTSAQAVSVNQQVPVSSVPESAMSAIFKLLSMLAKLLHQRSIDVDMAMRFLNNLPFSTASNLDNRALSESSKSVSMEDGRMAAFEAIYNLASQVCAADKRRWHHRFVFLLAWLEYTILGTPSQAKLTLQTVLQTRNSNRLLSSFYKPDFEAPGKHYHYLEKYLGLYIDTLVATSDIEGVGVLLRKLKRCSDLFFDSHSMLQRVKKAEFATIDRMVHDLNCPRFVVDDLGKEHIVLQDALSGARFAKEYSVTRHCRLNRTQFNFARDFARDNISFYISLKEHINNIVAAREKENAGQRDSVVETDSTLEPADNAKTSLDVIKRAQQEIEQYVDSATKALAMFDILLEKKKKHFDNADILFRLNENMADLYILVLSIYGQERLYSLSQPHQCDDIDELASLCTKAISLINSHQDPKGTSNSFWQRVLFDEANNESSQQYKLLDPLLEFNVNKLLDAVRDARALQPNPFVRNKPRMDTAQVLVQAAPKSTLATSSNGDLQQANQPSTS